MLRGAIAITYRKAGDQAASSRLLCPYDLVYASGMWYVVANCGDEGLRFFRLDRVEDVEILAYPEMALTTYFPKRIRDDYDQFFETEVPPKALEPLLLLVAFVVVSVGHPVANAAAVPTSTRIGVIRK